MVVLHFLKTILVPLLAAALLYLVAVYLLLPFIRAHRTRYSQYLPLTAPPSWDTSTSTFRARLTSGLASIFIPSRFRRRHEVIDAGDGDEDLFDDEEGEGMVGFDELEGDARRREALEEQRRVGSLGTEQRRLSRELEEGFRDESEDEDEDEDSKRRRSLSRERLY